MLRSKRLNHIILERNIEYSTYPVSNFDRKKLNPMVAFRTHKERSNISRKDALTWPAHMITNSSHVLVTVPFYWPWHTSTNLKLAGWPFWCPYRNVDFSAYNRAQDNHLPKATKLGLRSTSSNAITAGGILNRCLGSDLGLETLTLFRT